MIPFWILVVACVGFLVFLFIERLRYKILRNSYESIKYYLDMYVSKYGPFPSAKDIADAVVETVTKDLEETDDSNG